MFFLFPNNNFFELTYEITIHISLNLESTKNYIITKQFMKSKVLHKFMNLII